MNKESHIIPFYKMEPPYMKFKGGWGYLGVILWDSERDRIQCHFCGKWFKNVGWLHLRKHNLTPMEYKIETGLSKNVPLLNLQSLQEKKDRVVEQYKTNFNFQRIARKIHQNQKLMIKNGKIGGKGRKKRVSIQEFNKYGTCEIQIKEKLYSLVKSLGYTPTRKEAGNLAWILDRRFGSYTKGLLALNLVPKQRQHSKKFSKEFIINTLRQFKKIHGRKPTTDDFRIRKLLPFSDWVCRHNFRTLTRAKIKAFQ